MIITFTTIPVLKCFNPVSTIKEAKEAINQLGPKQASKSRSKTSTPERLIYRSRILPRRRDFEKVQGKASPESIKTYLEQRE